MAKQEVEIAVCALQRSGHHCVMDWLQAALRGKYGNTIRYINWVNEFLPQIDPFNTNTHPTDDSHKCGHGDRGKPRKVLIYNFEDVGLYMMRSMEMVAEKFNGKSKKRYTVLIMRDFYNLLASRMERTRKGKPLDHPYNALVGLWLEHAKAAQKTGDYANLENLVTINYNRWFSEAGYRKVLCDILKCKYTEDTMDHVHLAGNGSSFTGTRGNGRNLRVLDRWETFKDDPEYIKIVNNKAIQRLNTAIFGWCLKKEKVGLVKKAQISTVQKKRK